MEKGSIETSIGTFVPFDGIEVSEEKQAETEEKNEQKVKELQNIEVGVNNTNKGKKIQYFSLCDLNCSDVPTQKEDELSHKNGVGITKKDAEKYGYSAGEGEIERDKKSKKKSSRVDSLYVLRDHLLDNKKGKIAISVLCASALGFGTATAIDIHNGPIHVVQDNKVTINRIVEEVTQAGPTSLIELAESAHTSPNAILYANGLKTMDEAIGKRIFVPYTFKQGDPLYTYQIDLTQGKTYETMELYRIAHNHDVSLQTFLDLNKDITYKHGNGIRFKFDYAIVPCFPEKKAQEFSVRK